MYISNGMLSNIIYKSIVELECPKCGYKWEAEFWEELGGGWLRNEKLKYCPECGEEGDII